MKLNFFRSGLTLVMLVISSALHAQIWPPICPPVPGPSCPNGPPWYTSSFDWQDSIFCKDQPKLMIANWSPVATPVYFQWYVMDSFNMGGVIFGPNGNDSVYVLGLGLICLQITDSSGCVFSTFAMFPGHLSETPEIIATVIPSHCGYPNGSILTQVVPSGFQDDVYYYLWEDGSTGKTLENVPAGSYDLTVTVHNEGSVWWCPAEFTITVPNSDSIDLLVELDMDSSCITGSGNIDLIVQPPDLPYVYEWSNGVTTQDLMNVPSGEYYVTVTGPTPCVANTLFVIEDHSDPIDSLTVDVAPTYCDLPNGVAQLTVHGGTGPFDFLWSNGEDTQDAMHLLPGPASVTVTGFGGCSAIAEIEVPNIDSLLTYTAAINPNRSCDLPDGWIEIEITPEGDYDYEWLSGENVEDLYDIPGGEYEVTITAGTCILDSVFTVADILLLPQLVFTTVPGDCGQSNGHIDLTVAGGVSPYTYQWSNAQTTQDLHNITAGNYIVTVTGINGCPNVDTINVSNVNSIFSISSLVTANTLCADSNGSIDLTVTPSSTYSFTWSNSETTEDIHQLNAGTYQVTVSQNLCALTETFTIVDDLPEPDTLVYSIASCNPADTGLFVSYFQNQLGCDSVVIHTVQFQEADTLFYQTNTCDPDGVGVFIQHYTTPDGCDSIIITNVDLIKADTIFIVNTTCDPALTGNTVQHLINQHGCDSTVNTTTSLLPSDTIMIASTTCDPAMAGVFIENLLNQYGCDSVVRSFISLLPRDDVFLNRDTCDIEAAGVYVTNYINQYGCDSVVTLTVTLIQVDTTFIASKTCDPDEVDTTITIYTAQSGCDSVQFQITSLWPLPQLAVVSTDLLCYGQPDGSITAMGLGAQPLNYLWSTGDGTASITGLYAGNYAITITDGNGCEAVHELQIMQPPPVALSFQITHPACFEQHTGEIIVTANGGVEPFRYSLDGINFKNSPVFQNLSNGLYTVRVLDANNCLQQEIIAINMPSPFTVDLGEDQVIRLGDTAVLHAIVSIPFDSLANITWSGPMIPGCDNCLTQNVVPVQTTTYSITVTDSSGCLADDSLTIYLEKNANLFVPNIFSPNGDQVNDLLIISGGPGLDKINSFRLFDRWGTGIFEMNHFLPGDPVYAWDGSKDGEPMNPGVYVYQVIFTNAVGEKEVRYGNVTLVR